MSEIFRVERRAKVAKSFRSTWPADHIAVTERFGHLDIPPRILN